MAIVLCFCGLGFGNRALYDYDGTKSCLHVNLHAGVVGVLGWWE
jgi:hypothetical protein